MQDSKVSSNYVRTGRVNRGRRNLASRERTQLKKKKKFKKPQNNEKTLLSKNEEHSLTEVIKWLIIKPDFIPVPKCIKHTGQLSKRMAPFALLFLHSSGLLLQALQLGISRGGVPIIPTAQSWSLYAGTAPGCHN